MPWSTTSPPPSPSSCPGSPICPSIMHLCWVTSRINTTNSPAQVHDRRANAPGSVAADDGLAQLVQRAGVVVERAGAEGGHAEAAVVGPRAQHQVGVVALRGHADP